MKKIFFLSIIFLCLTLCSCKQEVDYNFINSTNEIDKISIVRVSFNKNNDLIQTDLCTIDISAFLNDFLEIDCFSYFGDPTGVVEEGTEGTVIKILYKNGEYELINWNGQSVFTFQKGFRYYAGYNIFDESQFKALITKYKI